jgi:hypothetical protein
LARKCKGNIFRVDAGGVNLAYRKDLAYGVLFERKFADGNPSTFHVNVFHSRLREFPTQSEDFLQCP